MYRHSIQSPRRIDEKGLDNFSISLSLFFCSFFFCLLDSLFIEQTHHNIAVFRFIYGNRYHVSIAFDSISKFAKHVGHLDASSVLTVSRKYGALIQSTNSNSIDHTKACSRFLFAKCKIQYEIKLHHNSVAKK